MLSLLLSIKRQERSKHFWLRHNELHMPKNLSCRCVAGFRDSNGCEQHKSISNFSCCSGDFALHLWKYQSRSRTCSGPILDFAHYKCLWIWYLSRSQAIRPSHCLDIYFHELHVCRLAAFNFPKNIVVSFWDIMIKRLRVNQYGLLPFDYTRSMACCTLEVKWETYSWTDGSLNCHMKFRHKRTLIYLHTLAWAVVPSLFAWKTVKKVKQRPWFSRLVQKMDAKVDRKHYSKLLTLSDHCTATSAVIVCLLACLTNTTRTKDSYRLLNNKCHFSNTWSYLWSLLREVIKLTASSVE